MICVYMYMCVDEVICNFNVLREFMIICNGNLRFIVDYFCRSEEKWIIYFIGRF